MFVPCIPATPRTTIINKTIVYSDTVLPLKDVGSNLQVSSISGVNENELEKCLKTIFEANPNVSFNTIQYSKNNKKVYLYTDKKVNTNTYEESKFKVYKPISSKTEILEEIKSALTSEKNNSPECVSLYDVSNLAREISRDYSDLENKYNTSLYCDLKTVYPGSSNIYIKSFDYDKNELHLAIKRWDTCDYNHIDLTKENGDVRIVKSDTYMADEVFPAICSTVSKLFDDFLLYKEFKNWNRSVRGVRPINANFLVEISSYGVNVYVYESGCSYGKQFQLHAYSYKDDYSTECNSSSIQEVINGNESELLKRIYVKISDCPIWMQGILHHRRKEQLTEEERIEKERIAKEIKKQKRLAMVRKVLPFI